MLSVAECVYLACVLEATARKPGNVHRFQDFEDLTYLDFLLSAEIEKRLAESASHQLPVNPQVQAKLPAGMLTPAEVKPMVVDWTKAADHWAESQKLMLDLFGR